MPGFDAIYKQTVTLFNRLKIADEETVWYPTVLRNVHLVTDHGAAWNMQGGTKTDNARLHVRYKPYRGRILVAGKPYFSPKEFRRLAAPQNGITFAYGDNEVCDFFIEGVYPDLRPISDDEYERHGFYNYVNKAYDEVFVITNVSKYNLIPHFEITAR